MASVRWRSPRPARGSRKKAGLGQRPVTVEGGGHGQLGHGHVPADQLGVGRGQGRHVAAPDAVAVDHADRLHHRIRRGRRAPGRRWGC